MTHLFLRTRMSWVFLLIVLYTFMIIGLNCQVFAEELLTKPIFLKNQIDTEKTLEEVHFKLAQLQPSTAQDEKGNQGKTNAEERNQSSSNSGQPSSEDRSMSVEGRFPGAKTAADPQDMILRSGGMPMDVPDSLDQPSEDRKKAILRRQQILNRFNPAIGFVIESVAGYTQREQRFVGEFTSPYGEASEDEGQVGTRLPSNFSTALRTIELFAAADVDTFARAYVIAAGHGEGVNEKGESEFLKAVFEIEEAAIQTTSLPYNLFVRGGRFFSNWGFLGRRHAHDLPQIDVPPSVALSYGQNRTDGFEVAWLAPLPIYLEINTGWGFNFGQLSEDALSPFRQQVNQGNTLFGSVRSYYDLNDDNNIELGFSAVYMPDGVIPRVKEGIDTSLLAAPEDESLDRYTLDWDFHYRWYPLGRGLRQSLSFHGEIFYDWGQGRRNVFGSTVSQGAWGGYAYTEYRVSKRWRPGFRYDFHQLPSEPPLVTNPTTGLMGTTVNSNGNRTNANTYSPYITFYPSEFQQFILQYNYQSYGNTFDSLSQVLFQWEVVIGSHQHGFTERD